MPSPSPDEEHFSSPLVEAGQLDVEYDTMRSALQRRAGSKTLEEFWGTALTNDALRQHMPGFTQLAKIAMCFPVTSVENERQFSLMNLIKTPARNRTQQRILNALCRIKRSSYTTETFPYEQAVKQWLSDKNRRGVA